MLLNSLFPNGTTANSRHTEWCTTLTRHRDGSEAGALLEYRCPARTRLNAVGHQLRRSFTGIDRTDQIGHPRMKRTPAVTAAGPTLMRHSRVFFCDSGADQASGPADSVPSEIDFSRSDAGFEAEPDPASLESPEPLPKVTRIR